MNRFRTLITATALLLATAPVQAQHQDAAPVTLNAPEASNAGRPALAAATTAPDPLASCPNASCCSATGGGELTALRLPIAGPAPVAGTMTEPSFTFPSDQRFGHNVRPLAGALTAVQRLRGVRYTYCQNLTNRPLPTGEQVGVIAQELEKTYPELVTTTADGYKTVNYAQLMPVLIEALKEQQQQIETLQKQAVVLSQRAAESEVSSLRRIAKAEAQTRQQTTDIRALQDQMTRLLGEALTASNISR